MKGGEHEEKEVRHGENGLIENEKEYMEAPYSAIFAIYSEDDIKMKTLHHGEPPYCAKIVRERKEEDQPWIY